MKTSESAKRAIIEKVLNLSEHVIYLDQYTGDGKVIFVYFINGFFLEVITDVGIIIDVLPYKRGRNFNDIKTQRVLSNAGSKSKTQS